MRFLNKKISAVIAILTATIAFTFAEDAGFTWQLSVKKVSNEEAVGMDTKSTIALQTNDQFTMQITSQADAYCYIIHEDTNGKINIISNGKISANTAVMFPKEEGSAYTLTPPSGTEKINICMSVGQQKDLENAFKQLATKKQGTAAYKKAGIKVTDLFNKMKLKESKIASTAAKPATVGAVTRNIAITTFSSDSDIEVDPEEFSNQSMYVKTLRITH